MTILSLAFPIQTAVSVSQAFIGSIAEVARPLFGLGIFIALAVVFKPSIIRLSRAALLAIKPRETMEQPPAYCNPQGISILKQMASELDTMQPTAAAQLRVLATRT